MKEYYKYLYKSESLKKTALSFLCILSFLFYLYELAKFHGKCKIWGGAFKLSTVIKIRKTGFCLFNVKPPGGFEPPTC